MVKERNSRSTFINSAINYARNNGFDGIDIDWEYPEKDDTENLITFLKQFRDAINVEEVPRNKERLTLSMIVSGKKEHIDGYGDISVLTENLDWISIKTYDYSNITDGKTKFHAQIYDNDEEVMTVKKGYELWKAAGNSKINLGLSVSGRCFTLASNDNCTDAGCKTLGCGVDATGANGEIAYYKIAEVIREHDLLAQYDGKKKSAYLQYGDQWISYDNRYSIIDKIQFAQINKITGLMIWSIDLDDYIQPPYNIITRSIVSNLKGKDEEIIAPTRFQRPTSDQSGYNNVSRYIPSLLIIISILLIV